MISEGEMSFEQHIKFVKRGLRLFEEQRAEVEKIKKEKEKIDIKKREIANSTEHTLKNTKKFRTIKRMKFLGNKRNIHENKNNFNMSKELICSIDEFIFHKREVKLINGYDSYFDDMKKKISESTLNTNGLNSILKLYKHMNNVRNFTSEISNKNSFISLKAEINKKIRDTLFDHNYLFSSSSFNIFCSNYNSAGLAKEGINICNLLDNLSSLDEEGDALKNNNVNTSSKKDEKLKNSKKMSESEDDKSTSFGSKPTKINQNEQNKQKLNIRLLEYNDLYDLLDIKQTDNELLYLLNEIKIKEIGKEMNDEVQKENLRKNVCLKLYKAFKFALKRLNMKDSDIRNICLYIEQKGRMQDNSMSAQYKKYIGNILKKLSSQKMIQINK